jgi:hypothetical protein
MTDRLNPYVYGATVGVRIISDKRVKERAVDVGTQEE